MLPDRIRAMPIIAEPWPHAILDDFLPADVFAELVEDLKVGGPRNYKATQVPDSTRSLLESEPVLNAIRERHGFEGGFPKIIEAAYTITGLAPHLDRNDKVWSGQVYLTGDPKGTELYNAAGKLAAQVEWKPNRLVCWTRPPRNEMHAAPRSKGRWVLLYWIMRGKDG